MCWSCSPGLGIIPVLFMVCSCLTILITYMISISDGHNYPYFPTISNTGREKPEANIFSLFLSISSFLGLITVIVRYFQFRFISREVDSDRIIRLNKVALFIGIISTVGASLVAAYQNEGSSLPGHILGAAGVFGCGTIYSWIQTYLTYHMLRCALNTRRLCWIRIILSLLCTTFIFIFAIVFYYSYKEWNANHPSHGVSLWGPGDPGYALHVASSTFEWFLALFLFSYFATFTKEFNQIKVSLHVQRHRNVMTPFQTSMSEDDSLDYA